MLSTRFSPLGKVCDFGCVSIFEPETAARFAATIGARRGTSNQLSVVSLHTGAFARMPFFCAFSWFLLGHCWDEFWEGAIIWRYLRIVLLCDICSRLLDGWFIVDTEKFE